MKDYSSVFEKVFRDFDLPSIVAGVYDHGETMYYSFGVYDDRIGKRPDENTRYMIGSTSKSFIAAAVCILASEGKIDLDEKITHYLPDFQFYNKEMTENITVRMILSHQTGLPRHDVSWVNHSDGTLEEMVEGIRYLQPAYGVGERFHYQNHMFALASYLVEKVTGKSWQEYVQEAILDPQGMERTWLTTKEFGKEGTDCARPYARMKDQNIPWMIWPSDNMGAAACITSTAKDALKWMVTNLHQGKCGGKEIFDAKAEKELHTVQMPIREYEMYSYPMSDIGITSSGYGMGWFIEEANGEKLITHGGTVGGFRSECGYLPEKDVAFAIFANLDSTQAVTAAGYALCDAVCGKEEKDWSAIFKAQAKKVKEKAQQTVKPLLDSVTGPCMEADGQGIYEHPAYGKVRISVETDRTIRAWFLGQALPVMDLAGEGMVIDAMDLAGIAAPCRFIRNEEGRVEAFAVLLEPEIRDYIIYKKVD